MDTQKKNSKATLILFVFGCFLIAFIGGLVTSSSVSTWYTMLEKPTYNPPSWVFGPVWSILYLMIAVSGWLIYLKTGWKSLALKIYGLQLYLNAVWSPLFFGLKQPGIALIDIALLWGAIAWTMFMFKKHSISALILLIPYFLWVTFATILNFEIWRLN